MIVHISRKFSVSLCIFEKKDLQVYVDPNALTTFCARFDYGNLALYRLQLFAEHILDPVLFSEY